MTTTDVERAISGMLNPHRGEATMMSIIGDIGGDFRHQLEWRRGKRSPRFSLFGRCADPDTDDEAEVTKSLV